MCIAYSVRKGVKIPYDYLLEGFNSNPHGSGYAYSNDGEVIIQKGFFTFKSFWESFKSINGNYDLIVHHRYVSAGGHNEQNCHPWKINQSHAMMHNGTLKPYARVHNGLSDTGNFNEQILKPMVNENPEIIFTPWFNALMSQAIGDGNKVVILNGAGKVVIFNEHLGNWSRNVWMSNFDYIRAKKRKNKVVCPVC